MDTMMQIELAGGVAGAAVLITQRQRVLNAAETYHTMMKDLYWKAKNVPLMVKTGVAGMDFSMKTAEIYEATDPDTAYKLRSYAKSIAYDLASFTWPGWDEPDIALSAANRLIGLQAAKINLQLAIDLDKDPMRQSRAYWLLGAQQMAAKKLEKAEQSFALGAGLAVEAGEEGDEKLCLAFQALAACLQDKENETLTADLLEAKAALKQVAYGQDYIKQVEDAQRIFG